VVFDFQFTLVATQQSCARFTPTAALSVLFGVGTTVEDIAVVKREQLLPPLHSPHMTTRKTSCRSTNGDGGKYAFARKLRHRRIWNDSPFSINLAASGS
jgi:hypothetical protein